MAVMKKMPKRKEVVLMNDKGVAFSAKHKRGKISHWEKFWNVKSDKTNKKGERTIVLKEQDRKAIDKKKKMVVEGILVYGDDDVLNLLKGASVKQVE